MRTTERKKCHQAEVPQGVVPRLMEGVSPVRATEQKRRPAHDVAARSCPSDPEASVATATYPCFSRLPSLSVLVRAAGVERHGCTVNVSLGVGGSPLC